jgi:hypothetical protein
MRWQPMGISVPNLENGGLVVGYPPVVSQILQTPPYLGGSRKDAENRSLRPTKAAVGS